MASKALTAPLIRNISIRGYAQAQAAPSIRKEVKVASTTLPNKTVVVALENGSPLTRVTVAFKAGSRYEAPGDLGVSHIVRSSAGLTTKNISSFMVARKLAQHGATVTASGDREFIYYTLEASNDNVDGTLEILKNLVSNQEFRPWEIEDITPRLQFDIAALPPQVRAVELLHKAAYRRGLGNSLFISPKKIGKVSAESLQHYTSNFLGLGRCAVAVVGGSQEKANLVAQNLQLEQGSTEAGEPSKYYGGDMRKEMGGELAHVALALKGAPAGSPQALALAVGAQALGCGPVTKWGSDNSVLAKTVGNIGPFAAAGFNVSYSDSGLYGVVLSVPQDEANGAIKAVASVLKNPKLSSQAIDAAKNRLRLQILSEADAGSSLVESLAAQVLHTGSVKSPSEIANSIASLSNNDISQAVSAAARSNLSMGAAGNLAFVPYVDEL